VPGATTAEILAAARGEGVNPKRAKREVVDRSSMAMANAAAAAGGGGGGAGKRVGHSAVALMVSARYTAPLERSWLQCYDWFVRYISLCCFSLSDHT
jgi:hypothetical protein